MSALRFISFIFISLTLFTCSIEKPETASTEMVDTVKTDSVPSPVFESTDAVVPALKKDSALDNLARFIAGMEQINSTSFSPLQHDVHWQDYKTSMDTRWDKMYTDRLGKIKEWQQNTFSSLQNDSLTLFYPFSGPDFLHAFYLYPHANTYILAALEPIQAVPALDTFSIAYRDKFLDSLGSSLRDIFQKSYFITKHMKADLKSVQGVLPPLYFFIERSGHELLEQKIITLDSAAQEKEVEITKLHWQKMQGVKLVFRNREDQNVKTLYYFSISISNGGLNERPEFVKFLNQHSPFNTFVKSASYLMHNHSFTDIKKIILSQAENIFQDDTGIPYKDISANLGASIQFYGEYAKPVKDFGDARYQPDLDSAFKASTTRQQLPFSLGYHWGSAKQHYILIQKQKIKLDR